MRKYPEVSSAEMHAKYHEVFTRKHAKYSELFAKISAICSQFTELGRKYVHGLYYITPDLS
jgi:hypothetical protein